MIHEVDRKRTFNTFPYFEKCILVVIFALFVEIKEKIPSSFK